MNKINDIRTYTFSKSDNLFLDANIWLSVYGPISYNYSKISIYSKAIRDIQIAGCTIFLDVLILSEFINSYARWEWNQASPKPPTFKDFRISTDFPPIAKDIANSTKRIIKQCHLCETNITRVDVEAILIDFEKGDRDFNDQMFSELCKDRGLILITDDKDFKNHNLTIITANKKLLN